MSTPEDALSEIQGLVSSFSTFRAAINKDLAGIRADLDEVAKIQARPRRGGSAAAVAGGDAEMRRRLSQALRTLCESGDARELQAMSVVNDTSGGYIVPPELAPMIASAVRATSPVRPQARVINLTRGDAFEEVQEGDEMDAAWVAETEPRPETTPTQFRRFSCAPGTVYAAPAITQQLLDDADGLSEWVAAAIGKRFGRAEGAAFVAGDGVKKPRGFTTYPTAALADDTRPWGTIQHFATGASGAFAASAPADVLMEVVESLHPEYRPRAVWAMRRATFSVVRKLKTSGGAYLLDFFGMGFAPPAIAAPGLAPAPVSGPESIAVAAGSGQAVPMLLGHPVLLAEDMPAIAANSLSIAFGDFSSAYTIVDKLGLRLLPDPYSSRPNVILHAWQRVGGAVSNFDAIKFVKFSTT